MAVFLLSCVKTMAETEPSTKERPRHWLGALRPLVWWSAFVLVLLGIHKHRQWMVRTRLEFSVSLEGQPLPFDLIATLDGRQIRGSDRLPLGSHKFAISHPKVEPFSTNLFIWYGEHNIGGINLKRAK